MEEELNIKGVRNIGILAHVDAGKTTLTEHILYKSEVIRSLGSVDKGTAHTDSLEVEKQRGISVKSSEANLSWKGIDINIIDTPGHVDFSAEVERSLSVLDGAVIVISAVEGVQPQTEVYFKALKDMKVPTIIFINKVDRVGADIDKVLEEINKILTDSTLTLEFLRGQESQNPEVELLFKDQVKSPKYKDDFIEAMAEKDELLLEKYLEGEDIDSKFLKERLALLIGKCSIYPVLYGAAMRDVGVTELLDSLVDFIPSYEDYSKEELSAIVFKVKRHKNLGKLAYIRLYRGKIESRDLVYNHTKDIEEKVTQIKKLKGHKEVDCGHVLSGEIACVSGLSKVSIGDILGSPKRIPKTPSIAKSLLTLQVFPKLKEDYVKLVEAFQELEEEDPLLNVQWIKEKNELHIQIMGMIQVEILGSILKSRFDIEVSFGKPSVIYKETPSGNGVGFESYTMPKPCWAVVKFFIEPLERGAGLVYESNVRTEDIKVRYQREIESQLPVALSQGLYGWEVIDLKVTLLAGEDHVMHSNPGDFIIATSIGIMNGLSNIGTTLLEPIIKFRISVPEEVGGKVLSDIIQMRGTFDSPVISKGSFTVEGEMPAATSLDYPIRLGIISSGKGVISTRFSGYSPVPLELGEVRERVGVNPLDRSKFILYSRNAIK
ncbi:TetM/TetW/TetO/TetS family tetracycline resistance ribosomal protection protein [Clostridium sp. MSJ-4]|uniref:TetM/TetW/TetO/TetS family tetracycline resistance ribosomal protection protein n=1 Tax=Clostridium simiarum TaxID=2841506 RepID=A0ABS6F489_9CLOT|nr:TetM/TetW/TetO/TetS family tetracycline resistance ribosomal protection protein [Clostridium simiarum]MBU5593299.1 TetM/TetW/TetO/TetS family tetracycline resistance ribosomal protection protein [Clostridium simiarum]